MLYDSHCKVCNPEVLNKNGELRDNREMPSIYVGETARSISERVKEHWSDFERGSEDSHILKHWQNHHQGEGIPRFEFNIVRGFKSALERQVAESVRIMERGNTLNSKSGYNRCKISRLVLEEKTTEEGGKADWGRGEENTEDLGKRGERGMWLVGRGRVDQRAEPKKRRGTMGGPDSQDQPKRKRRKKMYPTLGLNWGVEDPDVVGGEQVVPYEQESVDCVKVGMAVAGGVKGEEDVCEVPEPEGGSSIGVIKEKMRGGSVQGAVKQKKWRKKKNGLFGWVTICTSDTQTPVPSQAPSKGSESR